MLLAGNYCYRINAIAPPGGLGDVGVLVFATKQKVQDDLHQAEDRLKRGKENDQVVLQPPNLDSVDSS